MTTIIIKLNKEGRTGSLALIGIARLLILLVLLPLLTNIMSLDGAATAFLMANTVVMIYALKYEPSITKTLLSLWGIQAFIAFLTCSIPINEYILALASPIVAVALMHITNTFTIKDLNNTLRTIIKSILIMAQ